MLNLAKGIVKYIGMALFSAQIYTAAPAYASEGYPQPKAQCTPAHCAINQGRAQQKCTPELEKRITAVEVDISKKTQELRLNGIYDVGICTLLEQRVVVGKSGWGTPNINSGIDYAFINPVWHPTPSLIREMRQKHPPSYFRRFRRTGGQLYLPPGKENPLGKVKFMFPNGFHVRMHGTNDENRKLFGRKRRFYSHGCIRVEDEVALLKAINRYAGNTESCDDACIDSHTESYRTKKIEFKTPVKIRVHW
jgi:lipoprotein-anchoring transpeptidase ErfK/SrfK